MAERLKALIPSFLREVYEEYTRDRGPLFAAAISFFGLLSLVPLMLLAIGVFGYIVGQEEALHRVIQFAEDFIPVGTDELESLLSAISEQSTVLSGIGLLGLLWTGSQVFVILQLVMNIALGSEQRVSFLRSRALAFGIVLVVGLMFVLSIGITSLVTIIRGFELQVWGIGTEDLGFVWDFLGILLPVLFSVLAFTLAYKFLPMRDIGWAGPLAGGITAGVLFEIAKHVFNWYVSNFANFSLVYGSLGGIIIIVLWIYYAALITVLGAEVASVYAREHEG